MVIGSKTAVSYEQAHNKILQGSNYYELHTEFKDIETDEALTNTVEFINKMKKDFGYTCYCVHSPMYLKDGRPVNLMNEEGIFTEDNYEVIVKTAEITEKASLNNKIVVVHLGGVKTEEVLIMQSIKKLNNIANKYNDVTFAIENPGFEYNNNGKKYNTSYLDVNKIVNLVEKYRNTSNIGVCIDICHLGAHNHDIPDGKIEYTLKEVNKDIIKLIHLSNWKNKATESNEHGISFDGEIGLERLTKFVNNHDFNIPVTLEFCGQEYLSGNMYRNELDKLLLLKSDIVY